MAFDVEGARSAGYTESEIADHLAKQSGFDAAGARKSGYTDSDIVSHLSGGASMQHRSTPVDDRTGAPYAARFSIGSAGDPQTKLARARAYFGDTAQAEGDRISYVDPASGRRMYVNPEGFDIGDIAGSAREIASAVPSVLAAPTLAGVAAGAGIGAGVGQGMDALAAYMARNEAAKRGNPMPNVQSPMDAAKDVATEAAIGTIGGGAMLGIGKGLSKVASPVADATNAAWQRLGLPAAPTLALAGKGRGAATVESALASNALTAGGLGEAMETGRRAIASNIAKTAEDVAGPGGVFKTPDELGGFLRPALESSAGRFAQQADSLYESIFGDVGMSRASMPEMRDFIANEILAKGGGEVGNEFASGIKKIVGSGLQDMAEGQLNVNGLYELRKNIGRAIDDKAIADRAGIDQGTLKKMYGIVTRDLESSIGDPRKVLELRDADAWYAAEKEVRQSIDRYLFPSGGATLAEQTGAAAMRPTIKADVVRGLEKLLLPDEFAKFRGSWLGRRGAAKSATGLGVDEVSPEKLMREISPDNSTYFEDAVSPEVRQMLIGNLFDDVRVAGDAMRQAGKFANTSNTARALSVLPAVGGLLGAGADLQHGDIAGAGKAVATAAAIPLALKYLHTNPRAILALSSPQSGVSNAAFRQFLPRAGTIGGLLAVHE